MKPNTLRKFFLIFLFLSFCSLSISAESIVFPGINWEFKKPGEMGFDSDELEKFATILGGRGCIVKGGYMVKIWGSQSKEGDWLSSAKPVLSTLLFFAINEGKVKNVDELVSKWGWNLISKDQTMTFRHLANMISGYARPEKPGAAWTYNDYAIQLYQKTLFDKVFKEDPAAVVTDHSRLGVLKFQDIISFNPKNRRMKASVRDFARIAWFWLNKGYWNGVQILPKRFFDEYMKPQVPKNHPHTAPAETNDYLGIGSFGGGSDHFTNYGAGTYGFNWWFNKTGRLHPNTISWPDAPEDTFMSIGAGGNCSVIIPSFNIVVVCAKGNWGKNELGNADSHINRLLKLLVKASGGRER